MTFMNLRSKCFQKNKNLEICVLWWTQFLNSFWQIFMTSNFQVSQIYLTITSSPMIFDHVRSLEIKGLICSWMILQNVASFELVMNRHNCRSYKIMQAVLFVTIIIFSTLFQRFFANRDDRDLPFFRFFSFIEDFESPPCLTSKEMNRWQSRPNNPNSLPRHPRAPWTSTRPSR